MVWYLAKLAGKNLMRQKKRTVITFLTLSIGIFSYIAVDSLLLGMDQMAIDNLTSLQSGHLQVLHPEYEAEREDLTLDYTFEVGQLPQRISRVNEVEAVTPRITFSAQLNNGMDDLPVVGTGVDPKTDLQVFDLEPHISGRMPQAGAYEAVVGKSLADLMELGVGDYFTLISRTKAGAFQAIDLEVVGLANTPHPDINLATVFLPLDVAAESLGMSGQATEIFVRLAPTHDLEAAAEAVDDIVGERDGLRAYHWREIAADFLAISESKRMFNLVFLAMIFLIGVIGVVNTILLSSMERVKEIGMMKAMGLKEKEIILEFALEAAGIGFLGSLSGIAIGAALNLYLINVGIDISAFFGDMSVGYPVTGSIYGVWNFQTMLISFALGLGVCLLASYLPARGAAAKDPIKSLQRS